VRALADWAGEEAVRPTADDEDCAKADKDDARRQSDIGCVNRLLVGRGQLYALGRAGRHTEADLDDHLSVDMRASLRAQADWRQ
jgi:hypothetical protein